MHKEIPLPSIERLCALYGLLERLERSGERQISSRNLGRMIGESAATVRKDIARLAAENTSTGAYEITRLHGLIGRRLNLDIPRRACIVGLGRMGQAILQYTDFRAEGIEICAAFDSDVNKLELLSSPVPLLPSHQIPDYVRSAEISLGILTVPPGSAQEVTDRLIDGGIRGIVNFSSPVAVPDGVTVRQISVVDELRILSVFLE